MNGTLVLAIGNRLLELELKLDCDSHDKNLYATPIPITLPLMSSTGVAMKALHT